jgi:branched-chain amino acid transport system permease protein
MSWLVTGLTLGGLYALIAQGFVLTFLTTRTLNFAIGEFMACAAFLALALAAWGWLPGAGRIVVAVIVVGIGGAIAFRLLIEPFGDAGPHDVRWLLTTVGLSIIVLNVLTNVEGATPRKLGFATVSGIPTILGVRVSGQSLLIAGVAVVLFTSKTSAGAVLRAVSMDPDTASLMGISPRVVGAVSYAVAMGLAALAGILWSGEVGVSVGLGSPLLVASFAVAIIGGLTSLWGPLLGGALYGVLTQFSSDQLGSTWGETSGLLLVVVVLMFRPQGLLGRRIEEKV